jgi:phospholipid/cholesterol/gamma-HCH transport system substrate-binding protein
MESRVSFAAVGAFVIFLATALVAGFLWLSSGKYYRKTYDTYQTYMAESVAGLNLSSSVLYRGVNVGRVRAIALAPGNVELVQLTLDIERGTPVKEDTIATLQTQGLTGIAVVELTAGHRESPPLQARPGEPYPVITAGESLYSRLETSIPNLLASLNRTSESLNALLDDENRAAVKKTIADLEVLSRTLAARSPAIDAGLRDASVAMQNTARFTAQLPDLVARLERSADAFDRMTREVGAAGASATGAVDGVRPDLKRFTAETLPETRALVADLRTLTATLQRTVGEIERNPGALLQGRPPAKRGPGE